MSREGSTGRVAETRAQGCSGLGMNSGRASLHFSPGSANLRRGRTQREQSERWIAEELGKCSPERSPRPAVSPRHLHQREVGNGDGEVQPCPLHCRGCASAFLESIWPKSSSPLLVSCLRTVSFRSLACRAQPDWIWSSASG